MKTLIESIKSIFNIDNNTAATLILTLSVFVLGYLINAFIGYIRLLLDKRRTKLNIQNLLSEIQSSVQKQHNNFQNFCQEIDMDRIGHHLKSTTINHLQTFNEISYIDFMKVFTSSFFMWKNKEELRGLNKVYKSIYYLVSTEERYPKYLSKFFDVINSYESGWNANVENLRQLYDEVRMRTAGQILENPSKEEKDFYDFIMAADKIWFSWQSNDDRLKYTITKDVLLRPLLNLCRNTDSRNFVVLKSFDYILGALYAFDNMEIRFKNFRLTLEGYRDEYDKVLGVLVDFKNQHK